MKRAGRILLILAICLVALVARSWNLRDVFVEGGIYFTDADCYSRMTRAAEVAAGRQWIISRHQFENWPQGVTPHTTALLDWLIAGGAKVLDWVLAVVERAGTSVLHGQTLDLSGALVSPLLGVLTCALLAAWPWRGAPAGARWVPALFFALSPVLVHGTLLGRPDHQSLLLFLLALALLAELAISVQPTRAMGLVAGGAWGLALWVSLYEPLVLLAGVLGVSALGNRGRFTARELRPGWAAMGLVFGGSIILEGWRLAWPEPVLKQYFRNWGSLIGELASLDPRKPLLYRWLGLAILPAPFLLYLAGRRDRKAWGLGILLALMLGLTFWQIRWGYFLGLVFALSLPWIGAAFTRRWVAALLLFISAWPLARDWHERREPNVFQERQMALQRREMVQLRQFALAMRGPRQAPFLAPWWISPAIAYWSGQPGVAGSSHESLGGIVDSARFYLAEDAGQAAAILKARGVAWVLADEASRAIGTSVALLDVEPPALPLAQVLAEHPRNAPPFLREQALPASAGAGSWAGMEVSEPAFYHLYLVEDAKLPQ